MRLLGSLRVTRGACWHFLDLRRVHCEVTLLLYRAPCPYFEEQRRLVGGRRHGVRVAQRGVVGLQRVDEDPRVVAHRPSSRGVVVLEAG